MSLESLKNFDYVRGKRLLCLEVNPPRGVDLTAVFSRLDGALSGVDLLNVTDSALARMKMAAIPFAALLRSRFKLDCVVNVSCRDRNVIALQSDLLAASALGLTGIVALTGDAVTVGDMPQAKGVFEVNSIGLLNIISSLNAGRDLAGVELKGSPAILPGVVLNPNVKNPAAELKRLTKKREAGALFALTQPVFDADMAVQFLESARSIGVPIFLGLLPFKSAAAALAFNSVPGIRFNEKFAAELEARKSEDLSDFSLQLCLRIADFAYPHVCGFHVISGGTPKLALTLTARLAEWLKQKNCR